MNWRHYLFAGFLVAGCAPTETPKEESVQSGLERICPLSRPDELTAKVIERYNTDPVSLRAAAQKMVTTESYHIFKALHDKTAIRSELARIFETFALACPGFEPTRDEINTLAQERVQRKSWDGLKEAFELFAQTSNREGQLSVAQAYEQMAADDNNSHYGVTDTLAKAIDTYRRIGDTANVQRVINQIFAQTSLLEKAIWEMRKLKVEVTSDMYRARGDYWLTTANDQELEAMDRALAAYQRANDQEGALKVLDNIKRQPEPQRTIQFDVATYAALFVGDLATARTCTEEYFVHDYGSQAQIANLFQRTGLEITLTLHQRRAEYLLKEKNFHGAYRAFQEAHDEKGLQRVVEAMGAP